MTYWRKWALVTVALAGREAPRKRGG